MREKAEGFLQWKGTTPCLDLRCLCGETTHIDADMGMYHLICGKCGQGYECGSIITMTPVATVPEDTDRTE